MRIFRALFLIPVCIACTSAPEEINEPIDLVNPFIGTGGHGHTYPGASMPFGMVQLSPDTRLDGWDGCSAYHYSDEVVYGFSHTHLSGTGVSDYGDILFMPCTGPVRFNNGALLGVGEGYASRFRKNKEKASPGYYSVHLEDYSIDVELSATQRAGVHRYRFPKGDMHIIIDLEHRDALLSHGLQQSGPAEVSGHRISKAWAEEQHLYFVAQFSENISAYLPSSTPVMRSSRVHSGKNMYSNIATKAAIHFDNTSEVVVKVGLSTVSIENARENLLTEVPDFDFERVHAEARDAWRRQLSKIEVSGRDVDAKEVFYTALYHSMLAPNLFSDVNGQYRGMDMQIHEAGHDLYTVFSLWDTFRALHPLFTIVERERTEDFLRTFLLHYEHSGRLPVWELAANETDCMIGYHSIPVVLDAFAKGITGFDKQSMLEAMLSASQMDHYGLSSYKKYGYVRAADEAESVSKTLEYAYDDWCIAQYALALGDSINFQKYSERAQYYRNLFDPRTGFFRARLDGSWAGPFDPAEVNHHYTEANAWQYSLFAPHDVEGLAELFGGAAGLEDHLDNLFAASSETTGRDQADITGLIGQYAHGNEPSHHMAYLYNHAGTPWKTQARVRQILQEQYSPAPDGLSGNEDCGQMSAWYVMSAMGFYSLTPGLDHYAIGTPLFDTVSINLENGNSFRIIAENNGKDRPYIQNATLNGAPWQNSYITHGDIMAGGELRFNMGDKPKEDWGSKSGPDIRAKGTAQRILALPFFESPSATFGDSLTISIGTIDYDASIRYCIDGGEVQNFSKPFTIKKSANVEAWTVHEDGRRSKSISNTWHKVAKGRSIALNMSYANAYNAGGGDALIDQLRGSNNFRTGRWQGYQGQDFSVVVDLGSIQNVRSAGAGFLQDVNSWIWFPPEMNVEYSSDGSTWTFAGKAVHTTPDTAYGSFIHDFVVPVKADLRFLRVTAPNYGPCPDWHMGAGGTSWLFADEVFVK